ncbi:MAG: glycoside hydrolase family 13 protein [Salegentibacter sp.]|uniref:glycoside hydrolase family 13 protein n=1 Tax=Salegentibacter sp. TaxID=1903072 RepID=UPI00286FF4D3|nr:glycoside hydrolase family 13 protein [Salegentibacter sp.]MDR9457736.1 glycoside hydrolase family 13 protein [Salegentibacter sp.]
MKKILITLLFFGSLSMTAQIERVEPPNWWLGFENSEVQLMIYGEDIGKAQVSLDATGINLEAVHRAKSPNYLFLDLKLTEQAQPGSFPINFKLENGDKLVHEYELRERTRPESDFIGFNNKDAIYLITPDRFANGDPSNDEDSSLREKTIDRDDDYGRHGGDIQGIIDHLDYIDEMGFTALWSSPLLINDMESGSYHGYAMTDFYRVDPRFGTLEEYKELAEKAREKGIKLIMDQVANHIGSGHWWMEDLPFEDWLNYQEEFEQGKEITKSNHIRTTNQDFYAAEVDKKQMTEGWFVDTMPDLNQENPFMAKYLIQNSIWWIEYLGLGGIRQDTYPYPDKEFMSEWAGAIMTEYPDFNIVGEEWSYNPLLIRYWQDGVENKDGYESNLRSTMDFAMQGAIVKGLKEEEDWGSGLTKLYEGLANDFAYECPEDIMIFPDNHDKSRIFTQLDEDVAKTKMAVAYMLVLPRIPQIYYGTEILMDDTANPGDHGLIRTEFPGGWEDHDTNAFTGEGLSEEEVGMQDFLKKILNYRKNSEAIHLGKTLHFAPQDGVYVLARQTEAESVVIILNKNEGNFSLDLERFEQLGLNGKNLKNLISEETLRWNDNLELNGEGVYLLTTKIN